MSDVAQMAVEKFWFQIKSRPYLLKYFRVGVAGQEQYLIAIGIVNSPFCVSVTEAASRGWWIHEVVYPAKLDTWLLLAVG